MHLFRLSVTALTAVAACVAIAAVAEAQTPRAPLTLEPIGASGEAIWPAFESWARNEDGTLTLLLGYMNRNDEVVEIPSVTTTRVPLVTATPGSVAGQRPTSM